MRSVFDFVKKWLFFFLFIAIAALFGINHLLVSNLNISLGLIFVISIIALSFTKFHEKEDKND